MKYAVIRVQGHQYRVSEGDEILVDKITKEVTPEVLMTVSDDKVQIGNPIVKSAKVGLKTIEQLQGEKIHIRKYKAKSRYRKHTGFRSQLTKLQVEYINL